MSAPDTNIEKQKKHHAGPLIGIAAGVVFAGLLLFVYLSANVEPVGTGEADVVESPDVVEGPATGTNPAATVVDQ
ncbi:MAG: hypothetical protein WBA67_02580 [Jannaschia sp.]